MSNRQFVKGIVACIALMIAFSGAVFLLNHGNSRPEGVAENWLEAIGDTTRKGVEADATRRADEIGAPELARPILWPHADEIERKAGFEDLEVGKAGRRVSAKDVKKFEGRGVVESATVGFRVNARRPDRETKEIEGILRMEKVADKWEVTALHVTDPVKAGLPALPSDGGPPPSSAPITLWAGALVGAALLGVITSALVRAAT